MESISLTSAFTTGLMLGLTMGVSWLVLYILDTRKKRSAYNAKRRAKYAERKAKKHRETGVITL